MALDYDQQFYSKDIKLIVGCDEAGRGCLLGDVFAGAVILPKDFQCDLINDSKQLTEKQREEAYNIIINNGNVLLVLIAPIITLISFIYFSLLYILSTPLKDIISL